MAENGQMYTFDGRERVAGLMEHNIGLCRELKPVKKLRWQGLSVDIAGRHTLMRSDLNYFTNQGLSYVEAVCRRYMADNAKPLWWQTQALASTRPVIRNKATARINVAFRQALHNAGYDIQGKKLPNKQNEPRPGDRVIGQLFGTVVIKTHAPVGIPRMPFKELQDYCESVVKALEQALGQPLGYAGGGIQAGPRQQDPGRPSGGNRGNWRGRGGQANKAGHSSRWSPKFNQT